MSATHSEHFHNVDKVLQLLQANLSSYYLFAGRPISPMVAQICQ